MMIRGIELHLLENEALSNAIRRNGDFFEAEILDYIAQEHPVQKTIIDAGANIGNHSVYFANFLQYETICAFEPIKSNFDLLVENLKPYNSTSAAQAALSHSTGMLRMEPNLENMGAGEIREDGSVEVQAYSLDKFHFQDLTLLKIDVEWHEPEVISGAQDTIFRCHPLILIEDVKNEYQYMLPNYTLEKSWAEHNTYLYRWNE